MKLSGNTVVLTGGGSGIGLALAAELLRRGNQVIITGRDAAKLEDAARAHPGLVARRCDVTVEEDRQALADWLTAEHPGFNVLINNAGVMHDWSFLDGAHPASKVEREITTNLTAPILLTHLLLPRLLKATAAAIVNVSSGVAYAPLAKAPVYSATKAALHSFTQSLRFQLQGSPVKIFEVAPGLVHTPMSSARYDKPETFTTPEQFAQLVLLGLAKDVPEIRPGDASALFYVSRFAPGFAMRVMNKKTRGELPPG